MKNYQALFFDVDNTILDFTKTEQEALPLLFQQHGLPIDEEAMTVYRTINKRLWSSFEKGEIDRDTVVQSRFREFSALYGRENNGAELDAAYRELLGQGTHMIVGAAEVLEELSKHYPLYIVTNGVSETQYRRLKATGLLPYFQSVFVSEDTGFQKPMAEFFDYVFERVPDVSPSHSLIIGDSLAADIQGGHKAGMDTCWFNPGKLQNHLPVVPDYEITVLEELKRLLAI
ncbi:YjjG family noncanonical pyrimidine nucleotidase [Terribacillus halophilus]|jgi:2-haloacid dehalogenase|uniref:YjjG family noncanonical pyrimidine nucleotidase n=1 Tax=Terribacillus halophilus TaxID=361279 RepID=UPI000985CB37|nr:YjjG family noncanonical pyrimidine nucleotidase [Terribacillus halophilus]